MTQPTPPASKLFIRSEVLSVIEFFTTVEDAPKQDKAKQLKRLGQIDDQDTVLKILVKELQRATQQTTLQVVSELLMELGDIEILQEPLWQLIEAPNTSDDIKDAANLILRHLGDQTDPSLYLNYLEDPEGLINRETERMLEVATRNPEALIDFIDFIFSLPVDEQCNLLDSLQGDYPVEYLVPIYLPTLEAFPPPELTERLLDYLGTTKSRQAALYLIDLQERQHPFTQNSKLNKLIQKSLRELKLAGVFRTDDTPVDPPHALLQESTLFECYATIPDGIGNQGLIISRQRENGDITMMSVAINDIHGIIDCFGFYQLSEPDFHRITKKFHEECSKIQVPAEYCLQKLAHAEQLNRREFFRIPYEYSCWKVLLADLTPPDPPLDLIALCRSWANREWEEQSANLYHHPDFQTWFLEEGDHPVVTELLAHVVGHLSEEALAQEQPLPAFLAQMEMLAETIIRGLLASDWRELLIQRLADSAYLFYQQNAKTFAALAATEVVLLLDEPQGQHPAIPLTGFRRQYGRRCVEEDLLRLKMDPALAPRITPYVDYVLDQWDV